ncbi:cyclase family protein [Bythopirellula goksoeyrii]|uniref:Kynurenine formamidase n=1 Tax=Bythopirellula goksoeyrii TaxID=1400387 RepID=A0A5B9QDA5_9BACT|nr:cyclase family protein [Bythopirellula goksoeyrii]QEG36874.1 Kynurenine formamidase [Bythopirellula goksoeyrii]
MNAFPISAAFGLIMLAAQTSTCAEELLSASEDLVDLTHSFDEDTIYWPTEPGFKLEKESAGVTDKGYYYASNRFATAEHGGTHIDAPIHFYADRETVDQIPLWRLIGPAVCVDVSGRCAVDRDYLISVEDLQAWEAKTGKSLKDKIVLLRTGYSQYWPNREKYLGTSATGREAVAQLHFPGLDPVAADWLVTKRNIRAVGIDTASIDRGQSSEFGSHVRLCEASVPAMENVADLDHLPTHGFTIIALPMKIAGGSGGPCRIVAVVEPSE